LLQQETLFSVSVMSKLKKPDVKIKLYILTLGVLMFGCETKLPNQKSSESIVKSDTIHLSEKKLEVNVIDNESVEKTLEKYDCKNFYKSKNYEYRKTDLTFDFYGMSANKGDSIFNFYSLFSSDSLRQKIKSIKFVRFDTIPEIFNIFKNVEHIVIEMNQKSIKGLDIFPNLKSVFFWGSSISINPSEKWLNRLEGFYAEKSSFEGLQSFSTTPKLKDIYFSHSSIEPFPTDFDQLKCLRSITLGAYLRSGEIIDLSKIDLALNPCLEKVEFNTWNNAFSGIPKGLDTNRTFKLLINHQKLTKEEKGTIKTYNERNKKASS
jgi:hypothetical protein